MILIRFTCRAVQDGDSDLWDVAASFFILSVSDCNVVKPTINDPQWLTRNGQQKTIPQMVEYFYSTVYISIMTSVIVNISIIIIVIRTIIVLLLLLLLSLLSLLPLIMITIVVLLLIIVAYYYDYYYYYYCHYYY